MDGAEKHQLENEKDPVSMMMLTIMMIMKMSANELMTVKTLTVPILVSRAILGVSICQLSQSLTYLYEVDSGKSLDRGLGYQPNRESWDKLPKL